MVKVSKLTVRKGDRPLIMYFVRTKRYYKRYIVSGDNLIDYFKFCNPLDIKRYLYRSSFKKWVKIDRMVENLRSEIHGFCAFCNEAIKSNRECRDCLIDERICRSGGSDSLFDKIRRTLIKLDGFIYEMVDELRHKYIEENSDVNFFRKIKMEIPESFQSVLEFEEIKKRGKKRNEKEM